MSIESWTSSQRICTWEPEHNVPILRQGDIHLWWVSLRGSNNELLEFRKILSLDEKTRADRYRFERHRNAYTIGRGVLRSILSGYTNEAANQIKFRFGPHGKPSLVNTVNDRHLCFNYTDANYHALYAFTWGQEIGVDLEDLNREVEFERIAERKFTRTEANAILSLPQSKRRSAFLACWTRKEGYGKAEGWGIHYPLDSIEVCVNCESDRVTLEAGEGRTRNWVIQQLYPTPDFVGTLVYPSTMNAGNDLIIRYLQTNPGWMLRP